MNVIADLAGNVGNFFYELMVDEPQACVVITFVLGRSIATDCAMYSTALSIAVLAVTVICCLAIFFVSLHADIGMWGPADQGINVHAPGRDDKAIAALALLRDLQGELTSKKISQCVDSFSAYLENEAKIPAEKRQLAVHALKGPMKKDEVFGPLLGDPTCNWYYISGDEAVARHWIYATNYQDPTNAAQSLAEQENAKLGMITALSTSYEGDSRICNGGKVQRLVVHVLQGRLPGVDVDQIADVVPIATAVNMFFNQEQNKYIADRDELLRAAHAFCNQNPYVEREGFIASINEFADEQGMDESAV